MKKRQASRRATILLMVVGMLSMLFVIVTAFLTLARVDRNKTRDIVRTTEQDTAIVSVQSAILDQLVVSISSKDGRVLVSDGTNPSTVLEDVTQDVGISSLEPVRDATGNPGSLGPVGGAPFGDLQLLRWPSLTSLERGAPAWAPRIVDLVLDSNEDGTKLNPTNGDPRLNDFWIYSRNPLNDADGDGIPDSSFVLTRVAMQMTNAIAGRSVALPPLTARPSQLSGPAGRIVPWQPTYTPALGSAFGAGSGGESGLWAGYALVEDVANDAVDPSVLQMRELMRTARYIPAVRVVSEGAKVSFYSPGTYAQGGAAGANPSVFNRDFTAGMLSFTRHPQDASRRGLPADRSFAATSDAFYNNLAANADSLAQGLARRGGILPADAPVVGGVSQRTAARVSAVQRLLESTYPYSFAARFNAGSGQSKKSDTSQRFMLTGGANTGAGNHGSARSPRADQLQAYAQAVKLDPTEFLYGLWRYAGENPRQSYDTRHLTSAYSFSDDLARITGARSDRALQQVMIDAGASPMGLVAGQTKFFLGTIADSRPWPTQLRPTNIPQNDPRGAFRSDGTFNPVTGARLIRQLADYYFEMLYTQQGWKLPPISQTDAMNMRRQALMLAVNTVSFAAPRVLSAGAGGAADGGPIGKIAPVYYVDTLEVAGAGAPAFDAYFGYEPQPFLTQALAVGELRPGDPNRSRVSLAVELYNPNDPSVPLPVGPTGFDPDTQALPLREYAITLGDPTAGGASATSADPNVNPTGARILDEVAVFTGAATPRLPGRSYRVITIRDSSGPSNLESALATAERDGMPVTGKIGDLPVNITTDKIRVNLWRRVENFRIPPTRNTSASIAPERWYLVDQITLDVGRLPSAPPANDPNGSRYWMRNFSRDTAQGTDQFGDYGDPNRKARWSVVTQFDPPALGESQDFYQAEEDNNFPISNVTTLADELGSPLVASGTRSLPFTPLPIMNANRTTNQATAGVSGGADGQSYAPIHGTRRPASFPTVGFLHFVPRFAHLQRIADTSLTISSHYTVGKFLSERVGANTAGAREFETLAKVTSDFGHMRLLDNNDKKSTGGSFVAEHPRTGGYFDANHMGALPWGQLVYDYFTTLNTADPNNDAGNSATAVNFADAVDPLRIPGRVNINAAPWFVLAGLPMIGEKAAGQSNPGAPETWIDRSASPSFWSEDAGVLFGRSSPEYLNGIGYANGVYRSVHKARQTRQANDPPAIVDTSSIDNNQAFYPPGPAASASMNEPAWYRLGGDLAVSIAAYRDRVAYIGPPGTRGGAQTRVLDNWWDSYRRGATNALGRPFEPDLSAETPPSYSTDFATAGESNPYVPAKYGKVRASRTVTTAGAPPASKPAFGFATLGELLNVKGFDGALYQNSTSSEFMSDPANASAPGDFFRSVAFMALLDTQWLTTRSNTFTVYVSIADRDNPQASIRSQAIVDRSNVLPRAVRGSLVSVVATGQASAVTLTDIDGDGLTTELDRQYVTVPGDAKPQVVSERRVGYYNAQYDD